MTSHVNVMAMADGDWRTASYSRGELSSGVLSFPKFYMYILQLGFIDLYIYVLHMAIPFEYKAVLCIHRFGFAGSICVRILMHLQLQYIARGVCVHDVRSSLPKGHAHCQGRLAEVCCLLVENYFNSSQVWSSRSFLQFLKRLRPSKNSKYWIEFLFGTRVNLRVVLV